MPKLEENSFSLPLDDFLFEEPSATGHAAPEQANKTGKPKKRKTQQRSKPLPKKHFRIEEEIIIYLDAAGIIIKDPCAVYDLDKAKTGLRLSEVRRIDRIGAWAVTHMRNPIGFHLEIYPDLTDAQLVKELNKLPKWLDRFGEQHANTGASSRSLFIYKVEWSRDGRAHVHLYCVADSWDKYRIDTLKLLLAERLACKVKLIPRQPIYDGNEYIVYAPGTGALLKQGRTRKIPYWHFLKSDFEDWRKRTTYAAKNHTRKDIKSFRAFHCSRVSFEK